MKFLQHAVLLSLLLSLPLADAAAAPKKKAAAKKVHKKKFDYTGEDVNFKSWSAVGHFMDEMVSKHGFERPALESLFGQLRFVETAVQLIKPAPPGKPKNWQAYRAIFIEPQHIKAGLAFWNEHAAALARAETQYGVPAEVIVGIIGIETMYGQNTGRFRVLDVLTTLAFAYPETPNKAARMEFFKSELEKTLLFAKAHEVDPLTLLGSYAGAVGLPQFMPGNILKYGVDFDQDGKIDLRNSPVDAIGSVANFLVNHGWQAQQNAPHAIAVKVSPARAWEKFLGAGLEAKFTLEELESAGIQAENAPRERKYGLIDLQNGAEPSEYWIGSANFFAVTQYNRSFFYAMSVQELGKSIAQARIAPQ